MLFSALTLTFICLISLYSFLLLVQAKFVVPGSFGGQSARTNSNKKPADVFYPLLLSDIGGTLYGPWMRTAILSSITISQIGFVAAYIIFVSQNLQVYFSSDVSSASNYPFYLGICHGNNKVPTAHPHPIFHFDATAYLPPTCSDPEPG
jgi:solute carrier family 36 (proton-coupled amino acid transporter)